METFDQTKRIIGGQEAQVVVGAGAFTVQNNMRAYALTCRIAGTVISEIIVQDEYGLQRGYTPTWLGIPLILGDYFTSYFPIVRISLTAATDSVILYCDHPYST
jgi:hypothetical protein